MIRIERPAPGKKCINLKLFFKISSVQLDAKKYRIPLQLLARASNLFWNQLSSSCIFLDKAKKAEGA